MIMMMNMMMMVVLALPVGVAVRLLMLPQVIIMIEENIYHPELTIFQVIRLPIIFCS